MISRKMDLNLIFKKMTKIAVKKSRKIWLEKVFGC